MRRIIVILVIFSICILLLSVILVNDMFVGNDGFVNRTVTVYVGVTYCGNSVEGGKALIDKVKDYTNLFVLQSGSLQRDFDSVDELGDYAISAGLYFLPYFGFYVKESFSIWLETAKQKWGEKLLGIYYSDESGGKMLDDYVEFRDALTGDSIMKTRYGDVVLEKSDGVVIHYEIGGIIHLFLPKSLKSLNNTDEVMKEVYVSFYPDGLIEIEGYESSSVIIDSIDFPSYATYEKLLEMKPLDNFDEAASQFTTRDQYNINYLSDLTTVFTSDYALYWFDYLSGYDVILAQIGWNLTESQQIALVRGAATAQNKDWGIIITWKYSSKPFLDTGVEIFLQMKNAYECGAKYFVLFNYYDSNNPLGTLKAEHLDAMEDFWNNVVNDRDVVHGSIKADAVLILPRNYGWGMRWSEDKIWGIFNPDANSQRIWDLLEQSLRKHESRLDIIYEDERFSILQEYDYEYYCNQK